MMMRKQIAIAALIAGAASGTANAYEIGHLTCQNVGQLAAHMLMARQSGVPPQTYLSALNNQLPPDAKVEREIAADVGVARAAGPPSPTLSASQTSCGKITI
jgi:hypothetical protein